MPNDRLITTQGFLEQFRQQHLHRLEKPFCFVLGAGASRMSKIPTGGELAMDWLCDLHRELDFKGMPLEAWATEENLGIPDFDLKQVASFYSQLYEKRFHDSPESGYAYIEDVMRGKEPSYGYSVLAYLLSETQHKIVITTNFDNLVADALSIHSTVFPLVVGHDSLSHYARVELRRPLIAKVHGGLGFAPKSEPDDLGCLTDGWCKALKRIFERCSPIVIGYDGNDGSLMNLLEQMPEDSIDNLRWCFYAPDESNEANLSRVPERVIKLVAAKRGRLVPIPGFDEIMLLLQRQMSPVMQMPDLRERMQERAQQRYELYAKQESELNERVSGKAKGSNTASTPHATADVNELLKRAMMELAAANKVKPWWQWENEAADAASLEEREKIYERGISALPGSAELLCNYAIFLNNERNDLDKAEEHFKRAIKADPKAADLLGNYAIFLKNERKNMDKAEEFFKRAIEADPKNAKCLASYTIFLKNERKDMDRAEEFYKRAIEADPKNANNLASYAIFLQTERKDMDRAEECYKRAIEADSKNANSLSSYAIFLQTKRKDEAKAEEFYKRAVEADPKNTNSLSSYASFLQNVRKDMDMAEEFFKRAIEADPKNTNSLASYASFLQNVRKDMDMAEEFYKRAIEADPTNVCNLCNCAQVCFLQRRCEEGIQLLKRADALMTEKDELKVELAFYHLAHDSASWPSMLPHMSELLASGARSCGWELEGNVAVARESGHANPELLSAIAGVISKGEPLDILSRFPEWPKPAKKENK